MSTSAELAAAASLFGDGGDSADPFATLGVPEEPAPNDPSGFFNDDGNAQWSNGAAGEEYRQEHPVDYDKDQGWYDEYGKWHSYDEPIETTTTPTPPASQETQARRAETKSYAPISNYAPQASGFPQAPATTTPSASYKPSPVVPFATPALTPPSTYDPYKPAVGAPGVASPPGFHSRTGSYSFNKANIPVVPASSTVIERPTVYNAYDPPIPPPKPSKRVSARPSRITSPALAQNYPGLDAYTQVSPVGSFGGSYTATAPPATSPVPGASGYARPPLPPGPPPRTPNSWHPAPNAGSIVGLPPPPPRLPAGNGLPNGLPPISALGPPPPGLPPPPSRMPSGTFAVVGRPPVSATPPPPPNRALMQESPSKAAPLPAPRAPAPPLPAPRAPAPPLPAPRAPAPPLPPVRAPVPPAPARAVSPIVDPFDPEGLTAEHAEYPFGEAPASRSEEVSPVHSRSSSHEEKVLERAVATMLPASEAGDFDLNRDSMLSPPPPSHPPSRPPSSAGSLPPPSKKGSYRSTSPAVKPASMYNHKGPTDRASSPSSMRSWPGSSSQGELVSAYTPAPRVGSPLRHERSISPTASVTSTDPYAPTTSNSHKAAVSPPSINAWNNSVANGTLPPRNPPPPVPNAYTPAWNGAYTAKPAPSTYGVLPRTSSPEPAPAAPRQNGQNVDSYAPKQSNNGQRPADIRTRSMSNSSISSVDPYAPSGHSRLQPSESSDYGEYSSRYNYPNSDVVPFASHPYDASLGQEIPAATHAQYAPSPSLMGSNDPLGRAGVRIPLITFGFGGKVVTCFHGASSMLSTGFDVALSSRQSTDLQIRILHKLLPESLLDSTTSVFPGPLFSDPGTPTTSLVRVGAAAQVKAKKARVVTYLEERAEEISRGIGYSHPGSLDRRESEGKLALVSLLKVMVDHDGQLSGSAAVDTAVRAALLPRLGSSGLVSSQENGHAYSAMDRPDSSSVGFSSLGLPPSSHETPIAVTTLRASSLDKIQDFLLRGERQKAYHYALDEKLWAHAMVIASSIDKDSWKEVVNEFLKTELGVQGNTTNGPPSQVLSAPVTNGREGLRVAYRFYSGQGAASVQELLPQNPLSRIGALQVPTAPTSHITPMSPNFPAPAMTAGIPAESLSKWPETAAMILSNPTTSESSSALTALGDYLISNQWIEAAHACYLLSPQTSPMGGVGSPSSRIVLVGSRSPHSHPGFWKDPDAIIFSEIVEFALGLAPPTKGPTTKGQEPFGGLPHLQAYKLLRASALAELGHLQQATRYTEAISASLGRNSPSVTAVFVEQLKGLTDRLIGAPHLDKAGWGAKMTKPSLDSIGTWIGGRFEKLITGDADALPPPSEELNISDEPPPSSGPFSHYSNITSAASSTAPSPSSSVVNLNAMAPPRRTGSAMSHTSVTHAPIDRASSAMDYARRRASPAPRVASANAATTTFAQASSYGQYGYPAQSYAANSTLKPSNEVDDDANGQASWWGSSSYGEEESSGQTPTAASFLRSEDTAVPESSAGFISLMDDVSYSATPSTATPSHSKATSYVDEEDDEDLGFGNSKRNTPKPEDDKKDSQKLAAKEVAKAATTPDLSPAVPAAGSWISRWWKKSDTPGPIKASLGEETSFVFDKDLKRWVNKKANGEIIAPPTPPPPPSRSQTASPGRAAGLVPTSLPPSGPARPSSAMDLTAAPPPRQMPRVRSTLAPTPENGPPPPPSRTSSAAGLRAPSIGPEVPGSPLSPTGILSSGTPPPGRPKSQASKRNIRSRYVDVLQT